MAPPSTPDKYPPEEAYKSPFVTVEVGSGATKRLFQIRKEVLTFYSGYFSAALSGRFMEAEENMCQLLEESSTVFEMFQHWMYDRALYESTLEPALLLSYLQIAQLWIFADSHDVPALQNKAIDIFARKRSLTKEALTQECGQYILENTVESSPLRVLVCEILRWVLLPDTPLAGEMFELVVRALPRSGQVEMSRYQKQGGFAAITDMCRFHVHGYGDSCGKS